MFSFGNISKAEILREDIFDIISNSENTIICNVYIITTWSFCYLHALNQTFELDMAYYSKLPTINFVLGVQIAACEAGLTKTV